MTDVQIMLTLPKELAEEARAAGLLDAESFAAYIQHELKRQSAQSELRSLVEVLRAAPPELSESEIEAELERARAERLAR
ncbi:MAG: hypothetical protein IPM16_15425 [Chloroflexi bacterium]|nr:hypothetical protein [Chloroflexota bacterium]